MNTPTVVLALLSAAFNAAASVFQRRAAVDTEASDVAEASAAGVPGEDGTVRVRGRGWAGIEAVAARLSRMLRRPFWLAGAAALLVSAGCQVCALDFGELSVVQPLLTTELLFTLLVGGLVFRHRPGGATWLAFVMLAGGLAVFLAAAAPYGGGRAAAGWRWLPVAAVGGGAVALLVLGALRMRGAPRAAALGAATAVCFAATAALIKEVTGRFPGGFTHVFAGWQVYAAAAAGLASVLMLQWTLAAGTLAASQPALTLGDALVSVALGWALFGERVLLGPRVLVELAGVALMAMGVVGLVRSPAVAGGEWDEEAGPRRS